MTVRGTVTNLLDARHRFNRTVFDGRRDAHPVLFIQRHNQLIGPIFTLSLRGNF